MPYRENVVESALPETGDPAERQSHRLIDLRTNNEVTRDGSTVKDVTKAVFIKNNEKGVFLAKKGQCFPKPLPVHQSWPS